MFTIQLKNDKKFSCDSTTTIYEAAKASGIFLEHSCLTARCRSCVVKVTDGTTKDKLDDLVLTAKGHTVSNWSLPKGVGDIKNSKFSC